MILGMSSGIWVCLIVLAAVLDWGIGDPKGMPHPIVWLGKLIGFLTRHLNKGKGRKAKGLLMWVLVIAVTVAAVWAVQYVTYQVHVILFYVVNLWFLETTLAKKSLCQAVAGVEKALRDGDLPEARKLTGYLVGRETDQLSEHEIIRAVVETTAENTIDGILAPLFYMTIGVIIWHWVPAVNPLVLAMGYKAVNTMDSMVGYTQEPYKDFGFFPAKLDDLFNYPIARIGSIFMMMAGGILGYSMREGQRIFFRDRLNHRSPNSAHPESVVAGLLGLQLGGTNVYFGEVVEKPTIGDARIPLVAECIGETADIAYVSEIIMLIILCLSFFIANVIY
jgi:adenosylcobinamide-phosphate synthase